MLSTDIVHGYCVWVLCMDIVNILCGVCLVGSGQLQVCICVWKNMCIAPAWDKGRATSGSPAGMAACSDAQSTKAFSKQQGTLQVDTYY